MANASYNTYQSPIDRAQAIRGGRLANETRQIQNDTAGINNQKQRRAVEEYDRTLKTTTLARDSYELLNAAPEMREQLIKGYAAKDQTGFWAGGAGKSSEELQQMLEMNVNRGQQIGVFGKLPDPMTPLQLQQIAKSKADAALAREKFEFEKKAKPTRNIIKNDAGQSFYEDDMTPVWEGEVLNDPNATDDTKEFEFAKKNDGFDGSFQDWQNQGAVSTRQSKIDDYKRLFNADEGMATLVADGKLETFQSDATGMITTIEPFTKTVVNEYMPGFANVPVGGGVRARVGPVADLWGQMMKTDMTGWEASVKQGLQSSIGQFTSFRFAGDDLVQAVKSFEMFNLDYVNALRQNPKFSEGERNSIEKAVSVKPGAMMDQNSFVSEIKAVDRNMRILLASTRRIAASDDMPEDARKSAQVKAYAVESYLQDLNVPAWVRNEQKEKATESGYTPEQEAAWEKEFE